MFLTHLHIKNFRGIEELSLPLDELCVLIGENNAGKSSILDALRLCLTRPLTRRGTVFEEYDYHLADKTADPTKAEQIEISLTFGERKEGEWPDEITRRLSDAEQVDANNLRSITLLVTSCFDPKINGYVTDYDFLDLNKNPLVKAKNPRTLIRLQQLVPTFYLESLRDATQEFRARSQFWGPFVKALELDDEARAELESALHELNQKVLDKHTAFDSVKKELKEIANLLPLDKADPVSIDAVPSKLFDILSRTQVNLTSVTGAQIPIMRHGSGTQSLSVICLFSAFLQSRLKADYGDHAEPLLALEEPEAHLHPSAIKAVGKMLELISGQKLISTHSGDLLASVPLDKICRLRREKGKIVMHRIKADALTDDEQKKLDYHIRTTQGSLLFSRCWLLVEGETEVPLIYECGRAMEYDLYAKGVSCVEFTRLGVKKFTKLADQLGIEWFVLADNDEQGRKYERGAKSQLGTRRAEDHIRLLDHGATEMFLCMEGFGHVYEASVSAQNSDSVTAEKGTQPYWEQVIAAQQQNMKTRNSLTVAEEIVERGASGVPQLLREVIEQAMNLAQGAG